nr:MAG TPA: prohead serine protease [Caudoviricetes sp.]
MKIIYAIKSENLAVKDDGYISGYCSVFGQVDTYDDTIEPHAYDAVVASGTKPLMFFNHASYCVPIGVWDKLSVDGRGLFIEGRLNLNNKQGKEVFDALKFGSMNGLSVAITMQDEDVECDDEGIRHIKNVRELYEVSIVNFPADKNARISDIKSDTIKSIRDVEHSLCEVGFSQTDAKGVISLVKTALTKEQRDADKAKAEEAIKAHIFSILNTKGN